MSKTLSIFAIASALLFGAVPGHAALDSNGIVANGFDNNGLSVNGLSVNGQQEAASPRMTIIAVELPKAR